MEWLSYGYFGEELLVRAAAGDPAVPFVPLGHIIKAWDAIERGRPLGPPGFVASMAAPSPATPAPAEAAAAAQSQVGLRGRGWQWVLRLFMLSRPDGGVCFSLVPRPRRCLPMRRRPSRL
jgi:hypothetical protein